ncbi:MAG: Gfo/Idh/MocA family oxidoreductase, partial [Verrucomicrobiota bacterium]
MKKYNVGIIGYGWVATAHIAAINASPHAQVIAIYSSRALNAPELSIKYGSKISTYTNLGAMLAQKDLHVVSVCSYPNQHRDHAVAAAQAGKHLIMEKPLALNWDDCLAIKHAVEEAKVKTCVCFECRFSSQFLTTKAILDRG